MSAISRLVVLLLLGLVLVVASVGPYTSSLPAQEPTQAGADAAADAPAPADAAATSGHPRTQNWFLWFLYTSGVIGFFILLLSMYFIATVVRLFIELRMSVAAPPEEIAQCEELLAARDFQGIYNVTKANPSLFSRLVSTGIAELPAGLPEARELIDRECEAETVDLEAKISPLAVIGSLGPMIGLIGTLKGMITSFSKIAMSDTQMKASEVAGGISEALILTFEGVALAVPAIFFFAFFRNRVAQITVETLLLADQFIRQAARSQAKVPTAAPMAAVPPAAPAPGPLRTPGRG